MHTTLFTTLALSLLTPTFALPHASLSPAPTPPFRLPTALRSRQVSPDCDLSSDLDALTIPFAPPTPALPGPDPSLFLASVVIGRGVQNYTCPPAPPPDTAANASAPAAPAKPTALGAVAVLYEASCVATAPDSILASLTTTALGLDLPADEQEDLVCDAQPLERAGHHYFDATGTPVFDFSETADDEQLGVGRMKVVQKSAAPVDAATNVPWLLLGSDVDGAADQGPIRQIYRVETRGGVAPATCDGVAEGEVISVQYAAEYWILSTDA